MSPVRLMLQNKRVRMGVIVALIVFGGVLLLGSPGVAYAPVEQGSPPAQADGASRTQGWGDDGIFEIGVEWINDFPGTDGDRSHWDESCDGLYYGLLNEGWTSRFHWTDWNAFENDFKLSSRGGWEDNYADNVDMAMICTHGSGANDDFWGQDLSSVYFGSTVGDQHLVPGDTYRAYGDKDLEWMIFDSCSVFSDGGPSPYFNRGYWSTAMDGAHLMAGFLNTMYVSWPGDGYYMEKFLRGRWDFGFFNFTFTPYTVLQSWFTAADYNQPTVTCARVLAETGDNFNDHIWGKGYVSADPTPDGWYSYWDHCSTGAKLEQAKTADGAVPEVQALPVLMIEPRVVDEGYFRDRIMRSFDISGTIYADNEFMWAMDTSGGITRTLLVDRISGSFDFKNLNELWVTPVVTPNLPSPREAPLLANEFFQSQGEGLPGVWYRSEAFANVEGIVTMQQIMPGTENYSEVQVANMPADVMVTYGRNIDVPVTTAEGVQAAILPVVGPGSSLRVYFGDGNEIIGMHGGARDVSIVAGAVVEIMPFEEAWAMFLADHRISLPELSWPADNFNVITQTLGYYEHPYLIQQAELIPVWIVTADIYQGMTLLESGVQIVIPAAMAYMPPQATILAPADGVVFEKGQMVTLEGSAQFGKPPYIFEWVSSEGGLLGYGEQLTTALWPDNRFGMTPQTLTLTVTDANGQSGSAMVQVFVKPRVYLPVLIR